MRKRTIWIALVMACLVLIVATPQRGQTAPGQSSSDDARARRSVAVTTLRAINQVEYAYRSMHGTFASWDVLAVSKEFSGRYMHFAALNEPQLADARSAKRPEILPGWTLRLNVSSDGKGYDVLLEDKTDKVCGYAAITNESGLIRQSKTIDCDI
jgi:hypothetical protein